MSLPKREQHQNNSRTTLDGAIDDNDTTMTVTDGSVFPSVGNFRLMIESEIIICTARSSNTLTIVRGQEGTTGASHADDVDVQLVYTAGSLPRLYQDVEALTGYSTNPIRGIFNDAGTGRLVASDFTWVNQGGSTKTDGGSNNIYLRVPTGATTDMRAISRTPGVATFAYVSGMRFFAYGDNSFSAMAGMGFRESATGKLMTIAFGGSSNGYNFRYAIDKWTDPDSVVGGSSTREGPLLWTGDRVFYRVELTATHVKFAASQDGIEFTEMFSETKGTHFTTAPDEVIIYGANYNNGSGSEMIISLDNWHKE